MKYERQNEKLKVINKHGSIQQFQVHDKNCKKLDLKKARMYYVIRPSFSTAGRKHAVMVSCPPSTMFSSIAYIVLLFIELSTASRIYFHPPLDHAFLETHRIKPNQARLLLSHHFGLEQFEYLQGSDIVLHDVFQKSSFVGEGLGNAFILNIDSKIARGEGCAESVF